MLSPKKEVLHPQFKAIELDAEGNERPVAIGYIAFYTSCAVTNWLLLQITTRSTTAEFSVNSRARLVSTWTTRQALWLPPFTYLKNLST